jgi:hypothetical protein
VQVELALQHAPGLLEVEQVHPATVSTTSTGSEWCIPLSRIARVRAR